MMGRLELLRALSSGEPVSADHFSDMFDSLADGGASGAEVGCMLGALAARRRADDLAAFVTELRRRKPLVAFSGTPGRPTVNCVGTGGGRSTFNITTTSAFLIAAAGAVVIKTGSSAYLSRSGFAETASALGVLPNMDWPQVTAVAEQVGIVFVHPRHYAPTLIQMAQAVQPASLRSVGSFLNAAGPLLAPVTVDWRFFGAMSGELQQMFVRVCAQLGDVPTIVVHGEEGIDEVSTIGVTHIARVGPNSVVVDEVLDGSALGLSHTEWNDLSGTDPRNAARLVETILRGGGSPAQTDIVLLNSAFVLWAIGLQPSLGAALLECREILACGRGFAQLEALRRAVASRA